MADPQTLLEEKISTEAKLALAEYDLRLAQEDVARLTSELQKQKESSSQEANGLFVCLFFSPFYHFIAYFVCNVPVIGYLLVQQSMS